MYLTEKLGEFGNLSSIAKNMFGSTDNLSSYLGEVIEEGESNKLWFFGFA